VDALSVDSSKCEKTIDEIGQRTWILSHESVATARELSQPCARNVVDEFQSIRRRDYYVLSARADKHWRAYLSQSAPDAIVVPRVHRRSLTAHQVGR